MIHSLRQIATRQNYVLSLLKTSFSVSSVSGLSENLVPSENNVGVLSEVSDHEFVIASPIVYDQGSQQEELIQSERALSVVCKLPVLRHFALR